MYFSTIVGDLWEDCWGEFGDKFGERLGNTFEIITFNLKVSSIIKEHKTFATHNCSSLNDLARLQLGGFNLHLIWLKLSLA